MFSSPRRENNLSSNAGSGPADQAIVDNVDVGIALLDRGGNIRRANAEWLRLTGLRGVEVTGRPATPYFPEAVDLPLLLSVCLRSGEPLRLPRRRRAVGLQDRWWEGSLTPVIIEGELCALFRIQEAAGLTPVAGSASAEPAAGVVVAALAGDAIAATIVDCASLAIRWANTRFRSLAGGDPATPIAGRLLSEALPWAREAGLQRAIEQVAGGAIRLTALQHQHPSADEATTWRWIVLALPAETERGTALVLGADVSAEPLDIVRVEEITTQTEPSLARLETVFASMNEGFLVADPTGRVLAANPAAAQLLGFPNPATLLRFLRQHRNRLEFQYADGRPVPREELPLPRILRGESFSNLELRIQLRRSTAEIVASLSGAGIRDTTGRVRLAIITLRDVTAERRVEAERQFLNDVSRIATSSLDVDQTLSQVAQLAVPRLADWCAAYLLGPEDAPRRVAIAHADPRMGNLTHQLEQRFPTIASGVSELIRETIASGGPQVITPVTAEWLRTRLPDPEYRSFVRKLGTKAGLVMPLTTAGRAVGALLLGIGSAGRSFTPEVVELAEEFGRRVAIAIDNARLYQLAQDAIAEREVFLSMAAHELRSPVTSLRGFTQIARRLVGTTDPASQDRLAHALDVVNVQADKLVRLVTQLLEVSRIETGRITVQREPVDLVPLVANAVANARARTNQDRISFDGPNSLIAPIDAMRIEQVLTNLLDNAIKYSPADAPIQATVRSGRPGWVEITIEDRGPGIAPEHRERIFDRFYQVEAGGGEAGMGLGLYISRQIVELHGGRIDAAFPATGGTRIVIQLPDHLEMGHATPAGPESALAQ